MLLAYFKAFYDYPYLSSSANHIYDLTVGYASSSVLSSSTNLQNAKKINMYTQMAQVMVGYDVTGSIRDFDEDGNLDSTSARKIKECIFINFARLLGKDEIKKGSFSISFGDEFFLLLRSMMGDLLLTMQAKILTIV